jgi:biofilm PGA synthesis N-glycosyltransferase PgaC
LRMVYENAIFFVFAVTSVVYVFHIGLYVFGANLYDIWLLRRQRSNKLPRKSPLVSVMIPAHNEELVIKRCLDSVIQSTYQKLQIIVIDDLSTDSTATIVKKYIDDHPKYKIRLVQTPKNIGKGRALNYALKRSARGQYVMTLDADSVITPETVASAIAYFSDPNVAGVAANVRVIDEPTVLGTLQKFEHMISYRSKKLYTLTNCEFVIGGVASTYRMKLLRKVGYYDVTTSTEDIGLSIKIASRGNRQNRLVYASDVVAMTEGVSTFQALARQRYRWKYGSIQNLLKYSNLLLSRDKKYTRSLTHYRLPLAFISELMLMSSPIIWGYVLYLTLAQSNPRLVLGAFSMITIYTLLTLWFDEHTSFVNKLRLTLYAPLIYFIFYIMDIVQFIAVVRCLYNGPKIVTGSKTSGIWVSPTRVGKQLA